MNPYWICFVLAQCNFILASSYFPPVSHQDRVKQFTEREFGGSDKYKKYQQALVLKFFQERIAFETAVKKRREPIKSSAPANLEHIYRLAQPKTAVEEPINLPSVIPKKLTKEEKYDLFARLAEPKNRTLWSQEFVEYKKQSPKKNKSF